MECVAGETSIMYSLMENDGQNGRARNLCEKKSVVSKCMKGVCMFTLIVSRW